MQVDSENKAIIVGGGYAGLAAAVALHKVGVSSVVLERAPSPQSQGFSIGAHSNAWRALEELGVADAVRAGHLRTQRWEYLDNYDTVIKAFQIKDMPPPPGKSMHELRVIRRLASPEAMVAALPPGTVHYGVKVADVRVTDSGAEVELEGGQKLRGKVVVCADGVHSKTAAKYHKAPLQFTKIIGWRAIVDMDCDGPDDLLLREPAIRVASGPNARVGWLPVSYNAAARKLTWYMFLATPGGLKDYNGDAAQQKQYWLDLVKGWQLPLYQRLVEAAQPANIHKSHIYQRRVQAGKPWFEGCMTGIGDSAHATRPDLGQGGAMALEGGVELGVAMKRAMEEAGKPFQDLSPGQIAAALRRFEVLRSHRVAHIINKSQFMALFFWATGFLPLWLMRLVQGFVLSPRTLFEHAMWTPSGSLTPPSLPPAKLANGIRAQ